MPLMSPPSAKTSEERKRKSKMIIGCAIEGSAKKSETINTRIPTSIPRTTPLAMKPAMMTEGGVGETRISSILREKNFETKKAVATSIYELVMTASITRPGTTKRMYGTRSEEHTSEL